MSALIAPLLVTGLALLVVPWFLYPALTILLARATGRGVPRAPLAEDALPRVSCILATRDDAATVRARVDDFLAQDYPGDRLRVVVAVDAAAAATLLPALRFDDARVQVVAGDAPGGKCPALNAAVRAADGEVLLFSDARQRFDPAVARRLVAALAAEPRLGVVSGRLLLPADDASSLFRLYSRYELALRAAEARLHSAIGVSGSVYAMPRTRWTPLPDALILDDLFIPMLLALQGWRVGFVPDAFAHETRRVSSGQEFRRKVRTLTGNFQLCAWLPALLVPVRNPVWLQFVCHKLLRLLLPWAVLLLLLGGTLGVVRLAGERVVWLALAVGLGTGWLVLGRDGLARRLRSIAVQFASMQAAVVVATVHGVRGRWDVWR